MQTKKHLLKPQSFKYFAKEDTNIPPKFNPLLPMLTTDFEGKLSVNLELRANKAPVLRLIEGEASWKKVRNQIS